MVSAKHFVVDENEPFEPDQALQRVRGLRVIPVRAREIKTDAADLDGAGAADGGQESVEVVGAAEIEGVVFVPDVEGFEQDGATGLEEGEGGWRDGCSHGFFHLFPGSETSAAPLAHPFGDVFEVVVWFWGDIGEIAGRLSVRGEGSDPWRGRVDVDDEDIAVNAFTDNIRKREERR